MVLPAYTTTIGTVRFMGWEGWVPTMQNQAERFKRLGQEGSGCQVTGKADEPKTYPAWCLFTSAIDAAQFAAAVEALPVDTYTMTDQWGYQFQVRVSKVTTDVKRGGGVGQYLVKCTLEVEYMGEL